MKLNQSFKPHLNILRGQYFTQHSSDQFRKFKWSGSSLQKGKSKICRSQNTKKVEISKTMSIAGIFLLGGRNTRLSVQQTNRMESLSHPQTPSIRSHSPNSWSIWSKSSSPRFSQHYGKIRHCTPSTGRKKFYLTSVDGVSSQTPKLTREQLVQTFHWFHVLFHVR